MTVFDLKCTDKDVLEVKNNDLILKDNKKKLSDILNYLPSGIIDKKAPGMGATTLELRCARNSIIVAPTKSLAYNKALKESALYVGSKMFSHLKDSSSKDVEKYIRNCQKESRFIKIVVVADSLWKVMTAIDKLNLPLSDFFLMLDEIDTYQIDSSYRNKLVEVVDYYFKFPVANRNMVSATILPFTDPILNNQERKCSIEYESIPSRDIKIYYTNNVNRVCSRKIEKLVAETAEEKIVIAYNSVKDIIEIIELLPDNVKKECGIACSERSGEKAGNYYVRIDDNGVLPKRITFITSTYFNGIDIYDKFHLIDVVNNSKTYSLLSDERLYQIQGRGRKGILSECLIKQNSKVTGKFKETVEERREKLLQAARSTINVNKCMVKHYRSDEVGLKLLKMTRDAMSEFEIEGTKLVRYNRENELVTAYFNIDSHIENYRISRDLYSEINALENTLQEQGHKIQTAVFNLEFTADQKEIREKLASDSKSSKKEQLAQAIIDLKEIEFTEVDQYIKKAEGVAKSLGLKYKKLGVYLKNPPKVIDLLGENIEKRKFDDLMRAVVFKACSETHPLKKRLKSSFKKGERYTSEQILENINYVYDSPELGYSLLASGKTAVSHLKSFYNIELHRKKNKADEYEIKSVKRLPINGVKKLDEVIVKPKHLPKSANIVNLDLTNVQVPNMQQLEQVEINEEFNNMLAQIDPLNIKI
jgi:hypothetical protein